MNRKELEQRLINFSVLTIEIVESMPKKKTSANLADQLSRSGSSASLNYGEAQSGESRKDFIHILKVVLKELRESFVCLKIIHSTKAYSNEEKVNTAMKECNELISIFVASIKTAEKNNND